jgi:hypothetical protein
VFCEEGLLLLPLPGGPLAAGTELAVEAIGMSFFFFGQDTDVEKNPSVSVIILPCFSFLSYVSDRRAEDGRCHDTRTLTARTDGARQALARDKGGLSVQQMSNSQKEQAELRWNREKRKGTKE